LLIPVTNHPASDAVLFSVHFLVNLRNAGMNRLGVGSRIIIMVVISMVVVLLVGGIGLSVGKSESDSIRNIDANSIKSIVALGEVRQNFTQFRVTTYKLLSIKAAERESVQAAMRKYMEQTVKGLADYEQLVSNDTDKRMLADDRQATQAYFDLVQSKVLPLYIQGQDDAAVEVVAGEGSKIGTAAVAKLDEHVLLNQQQADREANSALNAAASGRNLSIAVIVLGLLLVGGLSFMITREIHVRMKRLADFVNTVSETLNFIPRIPIVRMDELGTTGNAVNTLMNRLSDNLKSIAASAESVAAASEQLATSSSQVATASSHQSEAASNVAATVEEMTVSINLVGDRAQEADRLSVESERLASSGGKVIMQTASDINDIASTVRQAAGLISGLEDNSRKISGVVAIIKDVADQTNLLALNAAIEAARAGEQGRGFAVVADEVRKLAERSAKSTQEISSTIEAMNSSAARAVLSMNEAVEKVDLGVQRAHETNTSIQQISEGCHSAVETVEEITNAIREQGAATNNIAVQVEKIAQMSEESSAAASETSQAAVGLDKLAKDMLHVISAYRLA
jgi:methyl-accepting chemotaxis protein